MAEDRTFAAAIRRAETGSFAGRYDAVRGRVREGARLVGAYGFASDEWDRLAEETGYPGAQWRSQAAQDAVAKRTFDALYSKYGDWRLVAIAWKGGEELADKVAADPSLLSHEGLKPVADYMAQVMAYANEDLAINQPVSPSGEPISPSRFRSTTNGLGSSGASVGPTTGGSARATLTGMLRGMRAREIALGATEASETPEDGSDG